MREVIGLFAYNRGLITDELVQMRYESSLHPPVRDSWAAMFPRRGSAGSTTSRCPGPN